MIYAFCEPVIDAENQRITLEYLDPVLFEKASKIFTEKHGFDIMTTMHSKFRVGAAATIGLGIGVLVATLSKQKQENKTDKYVES